jgi:predicted lipoprotein with Yx(FWY)xxD motif
MNMKSPSVVTRQSSRRKIGIGIVAASGAAVLAVATMSLAGGAAAAPTTLKVVQNASWGPTLALKNGDTVYAFSLDKKNKSNCTGKCAVSWPPVLLAHGQTKADGMGVKAADLGSIMRANGTHQVTYEGIPLYRFVGDKEAGQVNGNITALGGTWWSMNPKDPEAAPTEKGGTTTTTTTGGGTTSTGGGTTTTTAPPAGGGISY